jgi:hypothetical protein
VRGDKSIGLRRVIRRKAMISKSKLFAIAVAATVGMASPAFAEFLETGTAANNAEGGLGNGGYGWTAPQSGRFVNNRSGLNAYAMVPHSGAATGSFGAQATGGGSIGYNENLRTDQW